MIIVIKNKSKVLCALCVYFVLDWSSFHRQYSFLVIFKFNNQKNTLKFTLNKHQCLTRVVFSVIFWLLNLNVTKVQSNFDGRTNSGFPNHPAGPGLLYTATVENLHSKGLRRCPPDPMNNVKIFKGWPRPEAFCYWYTANTNLLSLTILVTRKSEYQLY